MNAYLVLGVPREATDQQIRQAYLEEIKVAPPELNPERFKIVAAAYESIKDEERRLQYELEPDHSNADSPLEQFLLFLRTAPPPKPLSFDKMKHFLHSCAKI